MPMWAGRRSPGAVCAFSRRIARCISGYGGSIRYTAAENAAAMAPVDETLDASDEKEVKLITVLKEVRKGQNVDEALKSYNGEVNPSILSSAMQRRHAYAYTIYSWAKSKPGFAYTEKMVSHLITALHKEKRLDKAQEIISEITGNVPGKVEAAARSKLFEAYMKENDVENAFKAKAELEERGLELQPFAVNRVIMLTYEKEGADAMLKVYKEYLAKGYQPDAFCLRFMVVMLCAKDKRLDDVFQIFEESVKSNVDLTEQHYMMLISKLVSVDRVKDAQQVAAAMMKFHSVVKSDGSPIKQLLGKLIEQKSYEDTLGLLKSIIHQKRGLGISKLMRALITDKEWDKAMKVAELLKEQDVKKDDFSMLIRGLCKAKRLGDARKAFDVMVAAGLAPDASACAALATCSASQ